LWGQNTGFAVVFALVEYDQSVHDGDMAAVAVAVAADDDFGKRKDRMVVRQ
jgi:hypothetical protein